MGTEVDKKTTPLPIEEVAPILQAELERQGVVRPTSVVLASTTAPQGESNADRNLAELILALVAIETANGTKMKNHNWGNISTFASRSGKFWRPAWFKIDETSSELMKRLHQAMLDKRAPSAFRAYDSHAEGAADYVRLLTTNRYQPLLAAARSGDANDFVRQLHDTRYSTDYTVAKHGGAFRSLQRDYRGRGFFASLSGPPPPLTPGASTVPPIPVVVVQQLDAKWLVPAVIGIAGVLIGAAQLGVRRPFRS